MEFTYNEQTLYNILNAAKYPVTWEVIGKKIPLKSRALRQLKEDMLLKGVPIGSKSGKKYFAAGSVAGGGIFLITNEEELADAMKQYRAQALKELSHAAALERAYKTFWNKNLFGEVK